MSDIDVIIADALQSHYTNPQSHVAALESGANLLASSLAVCDVTGRDRLRFPPPVLRDMARDMVIEGRSAWLLDLPLVHVFNPIIKENGDLEYSETVAGRQVKQRSGDYFYVRWSDSSDRQGKSALYRARQLWKAASGTESALALEYQLPTGLVIAMPNTIKEQEPKTAKPKEKIRDTITKSIRTLRGGIALLPTTQQGKMREGDVPRKGDYEPTRIQPNPPQTTITAHKLLCEDVWRCLGINPILMSSTIQADRLERQHLYGVQVRAMANYVEYAALQKGMRIEISIEPLMMHDARGTATAFKDYVDSGLTPEQAADILGVKLPAEAEVLV